MKTQAGIVLRHLRGLAAPGDVPDGQLLERFTARREEAAFAALVRRHGPMVLGVCRRVLRQEQDAEDAFQAAFLALARKAPSISKRDSVGSWLYQVAYHVAMKSRERTANRQRREQRVAAREPADPLAEITGRELLAVFDEELSRLPERQRAPLVLCYLQGLTRDLAARQLGCSESTLHRRLDEGRERLRERLGRRGLALPAALLATGAVAGGVPRALAATSVQAALGKAVPAAVAALAREALRGAPRTTSKAVGALLLAAGLVAAAAGLVGSPTPAAVGNDPPRAEAKTPKPDRPADAGSPVKPDLTVKGTVVDADGKPVAAAKVAAIGLIEQPYRGRVGERGHKILAGGLTDKEGHFRLDCAPATPSRRPIRQVIASAPGHGLGWLLLPDDAGKTDLTIKLPPEQVIRGRLLDLEGQAAAGVKLHVAEVAPDQGTGTSSGSSSGIGGGTAGSVSFTSVRAAADTTAPPWYDFPAQPARLDAWPAAISTDNDGRFVVRGVGTKQIVKLLVTDERFARQELLVGTAAKDKPGSVERVLEPAHWLEGTVVGEDTGKPIGKRLLLNVRQQRGGSFQVWADEKGRFRVNCPPGNMNVEPYAPDGSTYLTRIKAVNWPKGQTKHEIEIKLPRGVVVHGKVTEAESGKAVAGAVLTYYPREDNPFSDFTIVSWRRYPGEFVQTKGDGTFEATVYPGKGTLLAKGPTRDYVLRRLDTKEAVPGQQVATGRPGSAQLYIEGAAPLDLKAGADAPEVSLTLRRGVTVKGRVLGPDGKPVKSAVLFHPFGLRDRGDIAYFSHTREPVAVKDGAFVLTGLDAKAKVSVYVLDRTNELGARAEIGGGEATVKLLPCGKAKARFVDKDGKPVKGRNLPLRFTLGDDRSISMSQHELLGSMGRYEAVEAEQFQLSGRTPKGLPAVKDSYSDAEGRVTVVGLIPGVTYLYPDGNKVRQFTAESGKTHDLGDVILPRIAGGGGVGGGTN